MNRGLHVWMASTFVTLASVLIVAPPATAADDPAPRITVRQVGDPAGDVVDSKSKRLDDLRGDIDQSSAQYTADWIQLEVRVRGFTDPLKDSNWASDSTYALWTLDTDGDEEGDYTVEYALSEGDVYSAVFDSAAGEDSPSICQADEVAYDPSGAYAARIDPSCLGRPNAVAWNVEMSYDTNAKSDKAPATDDRAPDVGFFEPVFAPAANTSGSAAADPTTSTVPAAAEGPTSASGPEAPDGAQSADSAPGTSGPSGKAGRSAKPAASRTTGKGGTVAAGEADGGAALAGTDDAALMTTQDSGFPVLMAVLAAVLLLGVAAIAIWTLRSRRDATVDEA